MLKLTPILCKPQETKSRDDPGFLSDSFLPSQALDIFVLPSSGQWLRIQAGAGGWDIETGKRKLLLSSLRLVKVSALFLVHSGSQKSLHCTKLKPASSMLVYSDYESFRTLR